MWTFTRPLATSTLIQPFPNPTRTQPTATQPRAKTNHPSCRVQERFRHNHPTFAILRIDNVELYGLGSSINCLGRRVTSYATRDAKEIAKLLSPNFIPKLLKRKKLLKSRAKMHRSRRLSGTYGFVASGRPLCWHESSHSLFRCHTSCCKILAQKSSLCN